VLVNCFVFVEGFDAPETSCVLMVKPTKSDLVYVQCVGRGLRLAGGKTDCLVLDFVPLDAPRNMILMGDLLGKPRKQRDAERKAVDKGLVIDIFGITSEGNGIDGDPDAVVMRVLDYLGGDERMRKLAWTIDGEFATCSMDRGNSLAIVMPRKERVAKADALRARGRWFPEWDERYEQISCYHLYAVLDNRFVSHIRSGASWDDVADEAERYAAQYANDWFAKRNRKWRKGKPSDKQRDLCMRLGIWKEGMTGGEAGQAITHRLSLNALERNGHI
jgi:hypothetical protein